MAFDKDKPAAGTSLRASNPEILANNSQLQTAIDNEHIFTGTAAGTQTGDHTQGSARCFSQSGAPATRIDGGAFLSTDLGSLWVDTDDNAIYILTATVPTWTPVSTEVIATLLAANRVFAGTLGVTGDFAVNTNKFTVTAASGNTLVAGTFDVTGNTVLAGTLGVTGVATLGDGSLATTQAEDDNSTQIATTAYTDRQASFSAMTSEDADTDALAEGVTYTATSDGFITAQARITNSGGNIFLTVDGVVVQNFNADGNGSENSVFGAVASGETFLISLSASTNKVFRWRSVGTLSKPTKP